MKAVRRFVLYAGVLGAALGSAHAVFADEACDARFDKLEQKVDAQSSELEKLRANTPSPAASAVSDTTFGGYGEIAYNAYRKDSSRNQADLKRFVLFVGHRFTDKWSFNSEVEWEHAVTSAGDQGETEIEQAYLNYQIVPGANLKSGLFLMPFGFINEHHEPPVFYGVERNEVEIRIIPSTWREGGVSLEGTRFGVTGNVGVTTGFDIAKFDDSSHPLSSVHQELQLAKARDLSCYGALNYSGVPGFNLGGALFTGNAGQGKADFKADSSLPDFGQTHARVTLWETHTRLQRSGLDLEALYAQGSVGNTGKINRIIQDFNTANAALRPLVPRQFNGWLLQAAYAVWTHGDMSLAPFVRYEAFNTQQKMAGGLPSDPANADRVTTFGLSFKPMSQIVFKADFQSFKDNGDNDRTNVGLGYMF
jgi:hypothetical protein